MDLGMFLNTIFTKYNVTFYVKTCNFQLFTSPLIHTQKNNNVKSSIRVDITTWSPVTGGTQEKAGNN